MHPVLVLPLNEGSGDIVYDRSGYNNHGTIYNAVWEKKWRDWLLYFNGTNAYVRADFLSDVQEWDELTVEAVFMIKSVPSKYPCVISSPSWSDVGGFLIFCSRDKDYINFRLRNDPLATETHCEFESPIPLNVWRHYFGVFKKPTIKTYIDGSFVHQSTWNYPVRLDGLIDIGRWGGNYLEIYLGYICIYKKALSGDQIAFLSSLFRGEKRSPPVF